MKFPITITVTISDDTMIQRTDPDGNTVYVPAREMDALVVTAQSIANGNPLGAQQAVHGVARMALGDASTTARLAADTVADIVNQVFAEQD